MPHSVAMSVHNLRPPWRSGESGNPLGSNHGVLSLAAQIRRETGQGQTLVAFMRAVAAGEAIPVPGGVGPSGRGWSSG